MKLTARIEIACSNLMKAILYFIVSMYLAYKTIVFFNQFDLEEFISDFSILSAMLIAYVLFFGMGAVLLFVRFVYKIWRSYYILFFYRSPYNDSAMHMEIQDNMIKDSYIEFGDGSKLPVIIKKVTIEGGEENETQTE